MSSGAGHPHDDPENWPTVPPGPSMPAGGGGPMGDGPGMGDDGMDDGGMGDGGFLGDPDAGPSTHTCDLFEQQCPSGQKCAPWITDGGGSPNATHCIDVVAEPAGKGEPCRYLGEALGPGGDDCDEGLVCWDLDEEGEGLCIALCSGSSAQPTCEDPNDVCVGKDFMLCFPRCTPLDDNCPVGCGCYAANETFGCFPDASGEEGQQGDACDFLNACDPGLGCVGAQGVDGCPLGGLGCCTSYCELGVGDCPAPHECVPWFSEGEASPLYENLGACVTVP